MFTCISYSCSPQWTMEFKQLVRCFIGKHWSYSLNCFLFLYYYLLYHFYEVQCPDTGKDTWNLLFDLVCHEFCQSDDPPIILQEQKTVLASVYSVLSAIYVSRAEQEYLKMEEGKYHSSSLR